MGTNATKKAASKIVAILLAALMLISVMPMTAFAGSVPATIVVDGLTLKANPADTEYKVGEKLDLAGFELEVTFKLADEIKEYGEAAKQYTVNLTDVAEFVKYGIICNYEEDQVLDIEDNLIPLTFNYGPEGKLEFVTNCYFKVEPTSWACATLVDYFNTGDITEGDDANGEYIIVVDGKVMLTSEAFTGKKVLGGLKANDVLATYDITVGNGKVITDLLAKAPTGDIEDVLWTIDGLEILDKNAGYELEWIDVMDADAKEDQASEKGLTSVIASANLTAYDSAWPVLLGDAARWTVTKDGKMYTIVEKTVLKMETIVSGTEITQNPTTEIVKVPAYIAVADGYAYLTTEADEAATVAIYRYGTAEVDDIEIAKNADKMTYVEGEEFVADGMVVNLLYNDKIVVCVPSALFDAYGIKVVEPTGKLSIKAHNDTYVKVEYNGFTDVSDVSLTVKALGAFEASIPSGKLVDGNYVIGWFTKGLTKNGKMEANTLYTGYALDADSVTYQRVNDKDASSTYAASTLASSPIQAVNDTLGVFNAKKAYTAIDDSMIWTVKFAGIDGYTIQQASTGKYLTRNEISYNDLWVNDTNAENGNNADAEAVKAEVKTLVLADAVSENAYWDIDGLFNVAIQSKGDSETDNYYIVSKKVNKADSFLAADVDNGTVIKDNAENFYFFKTGDITIKSIEIIDPPMVDGLKAGDKIDLHDMVVAITYSDNSTAKVPYDDFASYGLTSNVADGDVLSAGKQTITVTLGDKTTSVEITVAGNGNTELTPVRMGGADRYETAAIIAQNYIDALGAEYKKAAVLVNSEQFPDALAGSTLAAALKAPIVITKADSLNAKTKAVLVDNKVDTVYVLGGNNAIGADVIAALKSLNIKVEVIAGANRIETSIAVAKKLAAVSGKSSDTVIITNGANFADALSASSAAAKLGTPILYVDGQGTLSADVKAFIADAKASKAVILGGTAAVSDGIAAELAALGLTVDRAAGADRFETSIAIAKYFDAAYTDGVVALATGKDFPDALAGGVYAAQIGAPVVLVDNGYANADAALYIAGLDLTNVVVFGGTDAVTPATVDAVLLK